MNKPHADKMIDPDEIEDKADADATKPKGKAAKKHKAPSVGALNDVEVFGYPAVTLRFLSDQPFEGDGPERHLIKLEYRPGGHGEAEKVEG